MITRFSIFKFIFSVCLINLLLAQDEDDQRGVSPSQDLYISFDQTNGNTNNLVTQHQMLWLVIYTPSLIFGQIKNIHPFSFMIIVLIGLWG